MIFNSLNESTKFEIKLLQTLTSVDIHALIL